MQAVRRRRARQIGALFLLAVLCLPLAWSGHHHHAGDLRLSPSGCTVCAAVAHAPALTSPGLPALALRLLGTAPVLLQVVAPLRAELPAWSPRGPPAPSWTLVA